MHDVDNPTTQPAAQPRVRSNTAPWHFSGLNKTARTSAFAIEGDGTSTSTWQGRGRRGGKALSAQDVHGLQQGNENQKLAFSSF
ncbi:hypothetical protein MY1884_007257 [Beauveria asiatica]